MLSFIFDLFFDSDKKDQRKLLQQLEHESMRDYTVMALIQLKTLFTDVGKSQVPTFVGSGAVDNVTTIQQYIDTYGQLDFDDSLLEMDECSRLKISSSSYLMVDSV